MYDLTTEQQQKLSTVLMEYLNVNDWKGLFTQTSCEEFAQQHTQFYEDDSWENDTLEQDCANALAFILNKDSAHLKVIWQMPGVQAMANRKDERFHTEINTLIENADNQAIAQASPDLSDENLDPYKALDEAENQLASNRTSDAAALIHVALKNYFNQVCKSKAISTESNDSISILHLKITDILKQQQTSDLNHNSLSMLRTSALITETINDLIHQSYNNNNTLKNADLKYAISLSRSVMVYLDELTA